MSLMRGARRWRRRDGFGPGGQALVQVLAHLPDQVLQHPDLDAHGLGAAGRVGLDVFAQFGHALVQVLHQVDEDLVRVAHRLQLKAQGSSVERACDPGMDGHGQAQRTDQPRDACAPSAATAPKHDGDDQGQAKIGADQ
jgi:hypothetical protein